MSEPMWRGPDGMWRCTGCQREEFQQHAIDCPVVARERAAEHAARAVAEPVEDVLAQHQPSETPGRCSCGFWEVTRHADHQAAMLRGEGLLP